jgi:hypothetical protein
MEMPGSIEQSLLERGKSNKILAYSIKVVTGFWDIIGIQGTM